MTTLEHAMVGIDLVLAAGGTRRYGWQLAAIAGVAATLPDWDGLPVLWNARLFDQCHRAWGHGLLSCFLLAVVIAWSDARYDWITRLARFGIRWTRVQVPETLSQTQLRVREKATSSIYGVWFLTTLVAILSHPLCDMIVSGGRGLSNWNIRVLWPFSDIGWGWSIFHWGDVRVTLVFVVSVFAMCYWKSKTQLLAIITFLLILGMAIIS